LCTPAWARTNGVTSPLYVNLPPSKEGRRNTSRRQLRFARYADDFLIFVRSRSSAHRVLRTVTGFIESHLALTIHRTKSKAARLSECTFLGFRIHRGKLQWTDAAVLLERLEATAHPAAAPAGPWHLARRRQTRLAQSQRVLAHGRKQYRPACPDQDMALGSRCPQHAATVDRS
jgi:hypothetical protein